MNRTTNLVQLWRDARWRGALTILKCTPELYRDVRVWRHIDLDREQIHFGQILEDGTFSPGERILIEIAASLFNGERKINLSDAFGRLDCDKTKLAIAAMSNFALLDVYASPIPYALNGAIGLKRTHFEVHTEDHGRADKQD